MERPTQRARRNKCPRGLQLSGPAWPDNGCHVLLCPPIPGRVDSTGVIQDCLSHKLPLQRGNAPLKNPLVSLKAVRPPAYLQEIHGPLQPPLQGTQVAPGGLISAYASNIDIGSKRQTFNLKRMRPRATMPVFCGEGQGLQGADWWGPLTTCSLLPKHSFLRRSWKY